MLKQSLSLLACSVILSGSTTMCYKKDHLDPSTIETVSLDGGECDGKLSVIDMKKDGYHVDTMKIQNGTDGLNYIYLFKKDSVKETVGVVGLKAQLKQIEKEDAKQKEIDDAKLSIENGKKIYNLHCVRCHGKKGEVEAYNSARALNTLSLDDMKYSIRAYSSDQKDNGMAMLMKPYAELVSKSDIEKVYNYIQTLKGE